MAVLGLLILLIAVLVGVVVSLANSGSDHLVTNFSFFGYQLEASTGRIFIYGAAVGALAMLGLNMLLAGLGRGLKNKVRSHREHKSEQERMETLEKERAQLAEELENERNARQHQEAIDITERSRESDGTTLGRHERT